MLLQGHYSPLEAFEGESILGSWEQLGVGN